MLYSPSAAAKDESGPVVDGLALCLRALRLREMAVSTSRSAPSAESDCARSPLSPSELPSMSERPQFRAGGAGMR
eukprot:SAG31_NODE_5126_length_2725_cov_1.748286_1_plen_75_part_00